MVAVVLRIIVLVKDARAAVPAKKIAPSKFSASKFMPATKVEEAPEASFISPTHLVASFRNLLKVAEIPKVIRPNIASVPSADFSKASIISLEVS